MGFFLLLYVKYFSGSWWPISTQEGRRVRFRSIRISIGVIRWSLLCAVLIVVIWQSGLVVTFRLIKYPTEVFLGGYSTSGMPNWVAWLMIIMASLVAGICEETGYRGYMQVPLETRYGPVIAIILVSIVFVIIHLEQIWSAPLLFHLFMLSVLLSFLAYSSGSLIPGMLAHFGLDIFNFSYWWTDVAGKYSHQPISMVGIDTHFITWISILLISSLLLVFSMKKIVQVRGSTM
jgi:membrane protease YdiL (CAAX protease family)